MLAVEESALDPFFGAGRSKSMTIVDDIHARTILGSEAFEPVIDELSDEPNQGRTGMNSVEPGMFETDRLCPESGGTRRGISSRPCRNVLRLSR